LTQNNGEPQRRTRVESLPLKHSELEPHIAGHGPTGWDEVISDCLFEIATVAKTTGVNIRIAQAKEKLAKLRIYADIDESSSTDIAVVEETPAQSVSAQAPHRKACASTFNRSWMQQPGARQRFACDAVNQRQGLRASIDFAMSIQARIVDVRLPNF